MAEKEDFDGPAIDHEAASEEAASEEGERRRQLCGSFVLIGRVNPVAKCRRETLHRLAHASWLPPSRSRGSIPRTSRKP